MLCCDRAKQYDLEFDQGTAGWRGHMKRAVLLVLCLALAASTVASAGNNPVGKIAVHVRGHNAKAGCYPGTGILDCTDIVTTVGFATVDAFPVFFDLAEYLGCEYGICWPDWSYSAVFRSCSDLVVGSITWPGDGASHTWLTCQTGVCIPSFIWVYADGPGMVCPCPHPISGAISLLDCAEGLDSPVCIFCAGVYGMIGDDPCEPTEVEAGTWGALKGMFE
jgi:hypothetical protein